MFFYGKISKTIDQLSQILVCSVSAVLVSLTMFCFIRLILCFVFSVNIISLFMLSLLMFLVPIGENNISRVIRKPAFCI